MNNDGNSGNHIEAFFREAHGAFLRITNDERDIIKRDYIVGSCSVRLKFANSTLIPIVTPAIKHLHIGECTKPDIEICLWDSRSTSSVMPPPPWSNEDYGKRGQIRGYNNDRFTTAYHMGTNILSIFDYQTKTALFWMNDARVIPSYESSAPLKSILHWAMKSYQKQMMHAAAIGRPDSGIVVVGKGGSGKSTIALSSLISPLYYVGDDYILFGYDGETVVYSIYNSAKVEWGHLGKFPHLEDKVSNSGRCDHEKAIIFIYDHYPMKMTRRMAVRAVVVPAITGEKETTIKPVSSSEGIKAALPSTIFQLAGADSETFAFVSNIMKTLPCYSLEVGTEINEISTVLTDFVDSL